MQAAMPHVYEDLNLNYAPYLMSQPQGIHQRANVAGQQSNDINRNKNINNSSQNGRATSPLKKLPMQELLSCFNTLPSCNMDNTKNDNNRSSATRSSSITSGGKSKSNINNNKNNDKSNCSYNKGQRSMSSNNSYNHNHNHNHHNNNKNSSSSNSSNVKFQKYNSFNGNYEGDISMLGTATQFDQLHKHRLQQQQSQLRSKYAKFKPLSYPETDSELDYEKEFGAMVVAKGQQKSKVVLYIGGVLCRLLAVLMAPEQQQKLFRMWHRLGDFMCVKFLLLLLQAICLMLYWLHLRVYNGGKLFRVMSVCLWRGKHYLRNATRRILWLITLAKCGDVLLYLLMICVTPWLFLIGIVGFVLSVIFEIKKGISNILRYLRLRMII